ncbi:MAG: type II secretion system F family protein [Candidatus Diapherotrites archaeon]|nr:type II secretion system F family protein [Candidatus Diapherotrites archaeon]
MMRKLEIIGALSAAVIIMAVMSKQALVVLLVIPGIVWLLIPYYLESRRTSQIEEELPEALLQLSALSTITSFESLVSKLGERKSALGEIFRKIDRQVQRGFSIEETLVAAEQESKSQLLSRTLRLLIQSYKNGGDIRSSLRETATDISEVQELIKEQAAATTIEKYTLLIGGGCLVPVILATIVSTVSGVQFVDLGFGMSQLTRRAVIANAELANQVYIAEYAAIASLFAGLQSGKKENAIIYALVLIPLSLLLFFAAKTISIAF